MQIAELHGDVAIRDPDTASGVLGGPFRFLCAIGLAVVMMACGGPPDENSGGDAYRNEAQAMPMDEWVTGEIDRDGGDMTDWKSVALDEAGKLSVELKADKKGATILVGVYDKYGASLGSGTSKSNEEGVTVPVSAKGKGKVFVKIEHRGGDKTAYSLRVTMEAGGSGGGGPDL